jgi:hypothetical protein
MWEKYGSRSDLAGISLQSQHLRASDGASTLSVCQSPSTRLHHAYAQVLQVMCASSVASSACRQAIIHQGLFPVLQAVPAGRPSFTKGSFQCCKQCLPAGHHSPRALSMLQGRLTLVLALVAANGHQPYLYKVPGSWGFSPNPAVSPGQPMFHLP